jgi:glucose-1-phosphate adenylyltransferase
MTRSEPLHLLRTTLTLLLAGGQGERLYPLTRDRAKPAVPFGGIYRIIDFTLSNCVNSSLRRIYVLTQYKSSSLDRHLRLGWNIYNPELGEFLYTVPPQQRTSEAWYRGTADAIYQNIYTLEQERPRRVLILSGDHVYKMDYSRMIGFHEEKDARLTVACVEMPRNRASQFGVMEVDEDSRVVGFEEKPADPRPVPGNPSRSLVSMGIYVFPTETLVRSVAEDAKRATSHDFGRDIIPRLVQEGRVYAYRFRDENRREEAYWRDIGRIDTYWEANMDLVSVEPEFNLDDHAWPLRTYQEQYPPVRTVFDEPGPEGGRGPLLNSLVGGGSVIAGGRVERSVLSYGVHVHRDAVVEDAILLEGVDVGRGAHVRKAIVDKDVIIPPGCRIGCDPDHDRPRFTVTEGGVVVVPKGLPVE